MTAWLRCLAEEFRLTDSTRDVFGHEVSHLNKNPAGGKSDVMASEFTEIRLCDPAHIPFKVSRARTSDCERESEV